LAVQHSELLVHVSLTSLHDDPPPAPPVVVLEPAEPAVCTLPSGFEPPVPPPEAVVPLGAALSSPPHRTSAMLGNTRKAATRIRFIMLEPSQLGS
jgi:hypothetical protein